MMADHIPCGDPCASCGKALLSHRTDHKPNGDPCTCGLPHANHRIRKRSRNLQYKWRKLQKRRANEETTYLGLDGEGQGRADHKYVLLAASTEDGSRSWYIENFDGLPTEECLEFLLELPTRDVRTFTFSFNYDLTMMLRDLDNQSLYLLFRPELRARKPDKAVWGPWPVTYRQYRLNLQGTKFSVRCDRTKRSVVIWDVFKFYQSKFVSALKEWKVGSPELHERMQRMKDKRHEFDRLSPDQVREYCFEECRCMAALAHKLVDAHSAIGLKLRSFYGAGSSAGAMLKVMGIKEKIKAAPEKMTLAVAAGFFGGRFENSVIGTIRERVWNYDISSAYPYQLTFLPCLLHGTWERTKSRSKMLEARAALVRYRLPYAKGCDRQSWGPFPYRMGEGDEKGSICFPASSGGGWVWREEFLAGERLFSNVEYVEAWAYHCDCDCQPFARIPEYYRERVRIGKEGPGIVIKLAVNSCYGKCAQSIGNAQFNSWVWAGLITSGTRAQLLDVYGLHKDPANLLMVATDGIYTRERIVTPKPRDTGTFDMVDSKGQRETKKPLGGWEEKEVKKGVFVARPGIYFPLDPTAAEINDVRGRGVGKGVVLESWRKILDSWEENRIAHMPDGNGYCSCGASFDSHYARVGNVNRFCGAKTSISFSREEGYKRAAGEGEAPRYGNWIVRSVELNFEPKPKREKVNPDGLTLQIRNLPKGTTSYPYDRVTRSIEKRQLEAAMQELIEQPDADFSEYEELIVD